MPRTHCASGHALTGDNVVHHRGRRRCRVCYRAAQARAYKARRTRQQGAGLDGLTQTALETMNLTTLAAKKDELLETVIPERKAILQKSEMYATRAERKADRLHKRMLLDQKAYEEARELYQRATEVYDRYVREHPEEEQPF